MRPFFFGSSKEPLFGIYHPPSTRTRSSEAVLFCHPFGREYLRAHRAVRELASRLASEGFHGLRFDYYGCGDSAGDGADGTLSRWTEDVDLAREELVDTSVTEPLSAVGLRLGASLALLAASRGKRPGFRKLVLWDPVVSGSRYLDELLDAKRAWSEAHPGIADEGPEGEIDVLGFPLTRSLRESIASIDFRRYEEIREVPAREVLVLTHREDADAGSLGEALAARGVRVTTKIVPGAEFWLRQEGVDHAVVPTEAIRAIAAWLQGAPE